VLIPFDGPHVSQDPQSLAREVERVLATGPVEGIVHLWGLDAASADDLDAGRLQQAQWLAFESAVEVIQRLQDVAPRLEYSAPRLWLVTRGAQEVVAGDDVNGLAQTPLWGLGRVIAEEQPAHWGGLMDVDPRQSPDVCADQIAAEILQGDAEDQVAYREGQRFAARLVHRRHESGRRQPLRWRTDASYLVTGGLGDIGLRVVQWMAEQGAHHLVVCSRADLPPRDEWDAWASCGPREAYRVQALRKLQSRGVSLHLAKVDVTDEGALRALLQQLVENGWPPLRGVFHAAGLADATPLGSIQHSRLPAVMGAKITGAWLLHELLQGERLDFFVCCSSGAALLPSPLMGIYAAASSFPDALARHRHARGLPALTVNWGFWEQTANHSPALRDIGPGILPAGMRLLRTGDGLAALQYLMETGAVNAAVMPVDLDEWRQQHPSAARSSLLADLTPAETAADAASDGDGPSDSPRAALEAATPAARRDLVQDYLRGEISRVLRIPLDRLEVHQSLNSLGIDSLMAVELRNHVQARLGVVIPLAKLLQDPTITQLSTVVLEQFGEPVVGASPLTAVAQSGDEPRAAPAASHSIPSAAEPPRQEVDATLALVQQLSDEEVDAMLRQLLSEEQQQA
jgi:NAD(P)-dependent dehydrogenase (short-subunit alcohol dehydrogenase family)/acyl carrier protein